MAVLMPVGRALDRQVGQPNDRVSKSQPVNNPARHAVRFWAYDNAIEASFFDQHVGGWVRGMPSCDALHQDGWKLGRPHEVDRLEWVWQPLPAPKSSFVHNQGGPLMEEYSPTKSGPVQEASRGATHRRGAGSAFEVAGGRGSERASPENGQSSAH
jgi:hypothetical protein